MRRLHLRGRDNILKRLLVHAAAFNISLLLRKQLGMGTPRGFQGNAQELFAFYFLVLAEFQRLTESLTPSGVHLPASATEV